MEFGAVLSPHQRKTSAYLSRHDRQQSRDSNNNKVFNSQNQKANHFEASPLYNEWSSSGPSLAMLPWIYTDFKCSVNCNMISYAN